MHLLLRHLLSSLIPSPSDNGLFFTTAVVLNDLRCVLGIALPVREVSGLGTVPALHSRHPAVAAIEAVHSLRETVAFITMIEV